MNSSSSLLPPVPQDPARSAGFHPSGAVLAVGTMTGRSASVTILKLNANITITTGKLLCNMTANVFLKAATHVKL